jgi:superfamily II DNA or RNA helicase
MKFQLRAWQHEALKTYHQNLAEGRKTLLWEATPGSGKTTAALQVCLHQQQVFQRSPVLIVVPTAHLRNQWAYAANQFGLHLDSNFGHKSWMATDYQGVVVTYHQVSNRPLFFRQLSRRAVVVLDEIHHAADGQNWGDSLRAAFEPAGFILSLSGTAFRSDNNPIPFVRYQDDMSTPDYVYSYGRAIQEQVCRPVAFFTYGGEVAWSEDEEIIQVSFADHLIHATASRRLRAALDPKSGWVERMLADAHDMLVETRRDHPEAGGLVVAADQDHARQLARLLAQISGTRPTLVLSDDSEASRKIKLFAVGRSEWLVACNMVSEGVDIPRLRVGVYATTVTTKMYFRQFLGRMVRMTRQPAGVQAAYCYLPADIRLKILAEHVEQEQRHYITVPLDKEPLPDMELEEDDRSSDPPPVWLPLQSVNSGVESIIMNGGQLSLWNDPELLSLPVQMKQVVEKQVAERVEAVTKSERKERLGKIIGNLAAQYHHQSNQPFHQIHSYLNRAQRVKSQAECTEEQLEERITLLRRLIEAEKKL